MQLVKELQTFRSVERDLIDNVFGMTPTEVIQRRKRSKKSTDFTKLCESHKKDPDYFSK